MADPERDRSISPASRRTAGSEQHDSIREDRQRDDHEDRHHGPHQEDPEEPVQVPDYQLESQPVVNGRQPARPGQPGRWEEHPGDRDAPGPERSPEARPQGQHEKA
ncbi:MAG TPA: hypothetical protein VFO85_21370 [Vicinamibacteria bacterium]|nr:hypothetical protein [Vicinamibacteria bacterium]